MKFRTKRESDDLDPSEGLAMSVCMYSACVGGGLDLIGSAGFV